MWICSSRDPVGASSPFCGPAHLQPTPEGWGHGPRWRCTSRKSEWMLGSGVLGSQIAKELIIPQTDFKSFGGGGKGHYDNNSATTSRKRLPLGPAAAEGGLQEDTHPGQPVLTGSRAGGHWLQPPAATLHRIKGRCGLGDHKAFPGALGCQLIGLARSYPVRRLPCARSGLRVSVQHAVFILIFDDSPVQ